MAIDDGVNGMFYLSLVTMSITIFTISLKYCYKSKCRECECLCIKITRDINAEMTEDLTLKETEPEIK